MFDVAKSHRTAARSSRNVRGGRSALIRGAFLAALAASIDRACADVPHLAAGTLSCSVSATQALVIGSNAALDCIFSATGRPSVRYVGEIGRVGIDLGFSAGANLVWAVVVSGTGDVPDTQGHRSEAGGKVEAGLGLHAQRLQGNLAPAAAGAPSRTMT